MDSIYAHYSEYYIVGHGMGGMVACHLALIDAPKVKGLCLIDPLKPDGYHSNVKIEDDMDLRKFKQKSYLKDMIDK